jgi:hypothetical protein
MSEKTYVFVGAKDLKIADLKYKLDAANKRIEKLEAENAILKKDCEDWANDFMY